MKMLVKDEAELSSALAERQTPVAIRGGGTRGSGAVMPDEVIDVSGMSGVTLYEPGALTIVAQAGTPVAEIDAVLAKEGQRLAFEPYFLEEGASTIGGVIATNASGPRRIQAGAARDFLLGVRFVDGAGRVLKNGGRVMKNVTGYDVVKLMAGSRGTLGVLSEVSLKVLPVPEAVGRVVLHEMEVDQVVAAMSHALGSPFEVTGAAYLPGEKQTWLRVEGFADQVAYRSQSLKELLGQFGEVSVDEVADWTGVRDGSILPGDGDLWRISVKPSDGPKVVGAFPARVTWLMDWGGGLIWARAPEGSDLRAAMAGFGGHATLMRAGADTHARLGTLQPESTGVAALSAGLRAKFDPRGILNGGEQT